MAQQVSGSTVRPFEAIKDLPFMYWNREEILAYALAIKNAMRDLEACTYKNQNLIVTTTPDPHASITISDLAGKILLRDP